MGSSWAYPALTETDIWPQGAPQPRSACVAQEGGVGSTSVSQVALQPPGGGYVSSGDGRRAVMCSRWQKESLSRDTRGGRARACEQRGLQVWGGRPPTGMGARIRLGISPPTWECLAPRGTGVPVSSASFLYPWWFLPRNLWGVFQNRSGSQWMQRGAWGP